MPIPPVKIDSYRIYTRVTCYLSDSPKPEIFEFSTKQPVDNFFPHLPKKHLTSFYFEIVEEIKTFTKGILTNKKENVSNCSKKYLAENDFK